MKTRIIKKQMTFLGKLVAKRILKQREHEAFQKVELDLEKRIQIAHDAKAVSPRRKNLIRVAWGISQNSRQAKFIQNAARIFGEKMDDALLHGIQGEQ